MKWNYYNRNFHLNKFHLREMFRGLFIFHSIYTFPRISKTPFFPDILTTLAATTKSNNSVKLYIIETIFKFLLKLTL